MNRIHRKSAIAKTAAVILEAHEQGATLLWDRYEQQVPLCAFTSNGLSCRKCFHGPCRINPFGDEPRFGVCGADRSQIVMENLFQATFQGVLETARILPLFGEANPGGEFPDVSQDLPEATRRDFLAKGLLPVRSEQIYAVANSYFAHENYLNRTLTDLMRLGLIHYGFLKKMEGLAGQSAGAPSFDPAGAQLLIVGQPSLAFMQGLRRKAEKHPEGQGLNIWVQGSKALASGLTLADQGSPEFALAMKADALVIMPDAGQPGLVELARKFGIPAIWIDETKPLEEVSAQAVDAAFAHRRSASPGGSSPLHPLPSLPPAENPLGNGAKIREDLKTGRLQGVLVILGEANVKQSFFERTLELLEKAIPKNVLVLLGGETGAQSEFLREELSRRLSAAGSAAAGGGDWPLVQFGLQEIPRVIAFLKEIGQGKVFGTLPAVVAFPEFSRASTWATAVTFLALGFAVQIGTPLPFWGSSALTEILLKEWPKVSGGALLASPSPASGQRQAEEILSYLEARAKKQG